MWKSVLPQASAPGISALCYVAGRCLGVPLSPLAQSGGNGVLEETFFFLDCEESCEIQDRGHTVPSVAICKQSENNNTGKSGLLFVLSCFVFLGFPVQHAYFPAQGSNLWPLQCELRVLTSGPPGKPALLFINIMSL